MPCDATKNAIRSDRCTVGRVRTGSVVVVTVGGGRVGVVYTVHLVRDRPDVQGVWVITVHWTE